MDWTGAQINMERVPYPYFITALKQLHSRHIIASASSLGHIGPPLTNKLQQPVILGTSILTGSFAFTHMRLSPIYLPRA